MNEWNVAQSHWWQAQSVSEILSGYPQDELCLGLDNEHGCQECVHCMMGVRRTLFVPGRLHEAQQLLPDVSL